MIEPAIFNLREDMMKGPKNLYGTISHTVLKEWSQELCHKYEQGKYHFFIDRFNGILDVLYIETNNVI